MASRSLDVMKSVMMEILSTMMPVRMTVILQIAEILLFSQC